MKLPIFLTWLFYFNFTHANTFLDRRGLVKKYFGNDAPWYDNRIPYFESSDQNITDVYYYRWKIFRAHQRDLGLHGYITTEFLNDVGWQTNPWASLNDATGFHLLEGRWCRDRRFKEDYATFMFGPDSNPRQFSESMAASVWDGYLVDGVAADATARVNAMMNVYKAWDDSFTADKGLYWVEPLRDATEYTISSIDASGGADGFRGGEAFRPSMNSYQYANAKAISALADMADMGNAGGEFGSKVPALKARVQEDLWNSTFEHFIDRYKADNKHVKFWDFIRGRELVGYVPWAHDLPDDTPEYAQAWKHILNSSELAGEHGLRTVEPSFQYYMYQYRFELGKPECQWNGPVWPFQTTQVLTGLANFLDHYPKGVATGVINQADYIRLLRQYAQLHFNPKRNGTLNLEEDYYPDTGAPIVGLKRSSHYFHSGFIDQVLTGLVGLRPNNKYEIEINPLINGSDISWFRVERMQYHGHEVSVQWDSTGEHYPNFFKGLQVEVGGRVLASSPVLTRLTVQFEPRDNPPYFDPRKALSIQHNITTPFPRGSASVSNADPLELHSAIDGRIFFFPEPEVANGWNTPIGDGNEVWFEIDFGALVVIQASEIAFFADEAQNFNAPEFYHVQIIDKDNKWVDVEEPKYGDTVANGITTVEWKKVSSSKVRLAFRPKKGTKARLVEFKIY
ncbi:uncharacterized protein K460DRAFT_419236 [Cucurbitaria berberidis CBS 394.84]|uniref:Mannosylglycerate hydrolase MGH1-like glycoside hydrolase domain-containing protein n=1 Tax=Cucurbitaria berberidis CBS 394.84 TaxID=1168544 RepID=A0A9P4L6Y1_9PLEO|nr:uncharacterized protein K460DRAFT_419236 [Cucurbitaria berberidis CBS 394.84]KAF1844310.1 hypothetical protein K460DRAFT_419236 [Cucurbitaria berberidis CBS 394.84]